GQGMSGNLASRGGPDQALAGLPAGARRGLSIALSERAQSASAVASGPALSTPRELVGTTARVAPANTVARSSGRPPWAPRPGACSGPLTAARSRPSSEAADPTVAPTTRPTEPSSVPPLVCCCAFA